VNITVAAAEIGIYAYHFLDQLAIRDCIMPSETLYTSTSSMEPKAKVLFPLYIYPLSDQTWKPLYES
jgi:hypothetical protein